MPEKCKDSLCLIDPCYYTKAVVYCELEKGHEGKHQLNNGPRVKVTWEYVEDKTKEESHA